MITQDTILNLIRKRYSCRSFTGQILTHDIIDKLQAFLIEHNQGLFGTKLRLALISAEYEHSTELKTLGTYGFIKGAAAFIIGTMDPSAYNYEDFGYVFEKAILYATDLGLGTCWLGGSFKRSSFEKKINCQAHEMIPAVVALGYKQERRRVLDSTIRILAGSAHRKLFNEICFHKNFDTKLEFDQADQLAIPLEMIRIAPSASNRQPWRLVVDPDNRIVHLYLQRTRGYLEKNRHVGILDIQRLDMGIAMCHFELACQELGIKGTWRIEKHEENLPQDISTYIATWRSDA